MKKEDNKKGNEKHTLAGDAGHKQGHSVSEATNVYRYRISGLVSQEKITKNPKINLKKTIHLNTTVFSLQIIKRRYN